MITARISREVSGSEATGPELLEENDGSIALVAAR
jgi:hypothetical protein